MNLKFASLSVAALALASFGAPASAGLVGDSSLFTVIEDFEGFDGLVTTGPVALGGGATGTASISSTFGAFAVDLGANGVWGAGNNFAGVGDLSLLPSSYDYVGSMTFSWSTGVQGVGGLFSIFQESGGTSSIQLEALDSGGGVLETYNLLVNLEDPLQYNAGTFAGVLRSTSDIYGLRITGDGFVVDNIAVAPVPLPAGLPLLLSGMAAVGAMFRRRRTASLKV
jgi:hypothetical protein